MTPPDHVGDDPVPHAGGGSQGLSTARLTGLLNNTYATRLRQRVGWGPAVTAKRNSVWASSALATAPTITPGTTFAASSIASPVYIPITDSRLRVNGGTAGMVVSFTGSNGSVYYGTGAPGPAGGSGSWDWNINICTDAPVIEVDAARTNSFWVWIDGVRSSLTPTAVTVAGSSQYYVKFDFGSRAMRNLTFGCQSNVSRLVVGPNDTVFPPTAPRGPLYAAITDSLGTVQSPSWNMGGGPYTVAAKILGWDQAMWASVGGTGYLNNNTSYTTFRERLQYITSFNPDILGTFGGINDQARQTKAALTAETTAYYQQARGALPNALFIAAGPWAPKTSLATSTAYKDVRDAILAGMLTIGGDWIFVDDLTGGWTRSDGATGAAVGAWITGEGKNGSTTGTGNADLYIDSAGTHPPEAGAIYAGHRLAQSVAEALLY